MIRLFTAIQVPEVIHEELLSLRTIPDNKMQWVNPNQFHITLAFIGDVNIWMYRQLKQQLSQILFDSITITVEGTGIFTNAENRPYIYYAKIKETEALQQLQFEIEDMLFALGIQRDKRSYIPHISLGRFVKTAADNIEDVHLIREVPSTIAFEADHFALYSSRLTQVGAIHTKVSEYQSLPYYHNTL